jgi:hypothetical protein
MTIFPVTIRAAIVAVPPAVVRIPATVAFSVQITPPLVRLVATFTVLTNRLIQFGFRALNLALALRMVV